MRQVVFLQYKVPRNMVEFKSLLERWESYDKRLRELNDGSGIQVVLLGKPLTTQIELMNGASIEFHYVQYGYFVYLRSLFHLANLLYGSKKNFTLVCGDNNLSLIASLIIRIKEKSRFRIQIQYHGDTYRFRNNPGLRGFVRVICSRFAIFSANSIRVVSLFQVDEIRRIRNLQTSKFVVAPISIDTRKLSPNILGDSLRTGIAVVGRLHYQRGVMEMIDIVSQFLKLNPRYLVTIAGDGPLKSKVVKAFEREIELGHVKLITSASTDQLLEIYECHKVLLSCAPNEGYGLAIREAILNGLRVVARKSKGAIDAHEIYGDLIYLYENFSDACKGLDLNITSSDSLDLLDLRRKQQRRDSRALHSLLLSWI